MGFFQDGRLTITGRIKDVIIIFGNNYYSHEIEVAVEEIPGVENTYTAVCAVRDKSSNTDKLAIFFSPIDNDNQALTVLLITIREQIEQKIGLTPDYLIPLPKEAIPKTGIGKIQRQQLRKRFEAGEFSSESRQSLKKSLTRER